MGKFLIIAVFFSLVSMVIISCGGGSSSNQESEVLQSYSLSGLAIGLTEPVVIKNDFEQIRVEADGEFFFATKIEEGQAYNFKVVEQPDDQFCTIGTNSGVASDNSVENIKLNCFDRVIAKLSTNLGDIYVWPYTYQLPIDSNPAVSTFIKEIANGTYNNTLIHRLIPGYLIQGGEYDTEFNTVLATETVQIEGSVGYTNKIGAIGLTKNDSNSSPGFFINLANNYHLNASEANGYYGVAEVDKSIYTQKTLEKISQLQRKTNVFDGPSNASFATEYIDFSGILSTGTRDINFEPIHTISDIVVYDWQGNSKTLSVSFELLNIVDLEWEATVTDENNAILHTETINFAVTGNLLTGHGEMQFNCPPVISGPSTPIVLNFGDSTNFRVQSLSFGSSSSLIASDKNGRPVPISNEQPSSNLNILNFQLLGRNRVLEMPQNTTEIHLLGNLNPAENSPIEFEIPYHISTSVVVHHDTSGRDGILRLVFTNENNIQIGQWKLDVYIGFSTIPITTTVTFDSSGNLSSFYKDRLSTYPDRYLFIRELKSRPSTESSAVSVMSMNGVSRWNQYVPISVFEFNSI